VGNNFRKSVDLILGCGIILCRYQKVLRPLLTSSAEDKDFIVELSTDLTEEEKIIIAKGEAYYPKGKYVTLDLSDFN